MRTKIRRDTGFTLTELLVVIAVLLLVAAVLAPALRSASFRARTIDCANHLMQIGLGFKTWALDNHDQYPLQALNSTNAPPNLDQLLQSKPLAVYLYQVFGVMSNELSTPFILVCPADNSPIHTNFLMVGDGTTNQPCAGQTTLCNLNISYFIGREATEENPNAILAGDRNLYVGDGTSRTAYDGSLNQGYGSSPVHAGVTFSPGAACDLGTNLTAPDADPSLSPCWTAKMHRNQGIILLADGSVQELSTARVRLQLRAAAESRGTNSPPKPNWLLFP